MELFLLIIRLLLAAIFATAGIAKFADLEGSGKAFKEFGVPAALALPSSIALSIAEIAIAVLFLFPSTSWFAALGAAGLLTLFIVQMVYQRAKGRAPDCHCFGQLHSEPVSFKSIARNVIFLALAAIPLYQGRLAQGLKPWNVTGEMMPTILGVCAVIMLGGALLYLRQILDGQKELRRRFELLELISRVDQTVDHEHLTDPNLGLPIGAPLPDFSLKTIDGQAVSSREIVSDAASPVLFFFVSPTCEPCQMLLPQIAQWKAEMTGRLSVVLVSTGSEKENREKFAPIGSTIYLDEGRRFAFAVGGRWTPTALLVNGKGMIASHVAAGDVAIEELAAKVRSSDLTQPYVYFPRGEHNGRGLKIGSPAPDFELTDVEGRTISSDDLKGKQTLAAFWSPSCPHCQAFLDEFRESSIINSASGPNVIVFSDGDPNEHRSLGLNVPVVIDKGYKIAGKLGMFGTPSAVLLNEDAVIATETAIGANNIFALLGEYRNGAH